MNRRRFLAASGAAAFAGPLAASAQVFPPAQPIPEQPMPLPPGHFQQQLTIAVVAAQNNRQAGGNQIAQGAGAAIDETNRFGGIFNTVFLLRTFDDQHMLSQALGDAQISAADPTVIAVIGGTNASIVLDTLPTYANLGMPLLVPGSTADAITRRSYRSVWRLPTKDSTEGTLFAQFLAAHGKPAFALAVTQDGAYGGDVARGFADQMKAAHVRSDIYTFPSDRPDYEAAANAVLTKKPDYIFLCGETSSLGPLAPALRTAGYKGRFGACEGFYNEQTLSDLGEVLGDALVSTSLPPLDRSAQFGNAFLDFRSHYTVTALSAFSYAAAQIVIAASRRTNATNRLTMTSALQAPAAYNTIVGPFQFGPTGDPIDPNVYFYKPAKKTFAFVAPAHPTPFIF